MILAFSVSYWFSISIALVYFIGLTIVILIHSKRGKMLEMKMLFNMALIVANLN